MKLFQNLFSAKWKSKNPDTRKQAILRLNIDENQAIFDEIANNDETSEMRLLAVKRLTSFDRLTHIAKHNTDAKARDLANKILNQILAGHSDATISLDEDTRLEKIQHCNDQKTLEYVALNANSAAIREAAINLVTRESLLGDLAIKDDNREIRKAVTNRISQKSTLERVLKAIKNKDKQISKIIKDKLEAITSAEEKPKQLLARQKSLCLSMEGLGNKGLWERDKTQFDLIISQWKGLESTSSDLKKRFDDAKEEFIKNYNSYLERNEERLIQEAAFLPIKNKKQDLLERLNALLTGPETSSINSLIESHTNLSNEWRNLETLPEDIEADFQKQFADLNSTIRKKIADHERKSKAKSSINRMLKKLDQLIKHPAKSNKNLLSKLESELNNLKIDQEDLLSERAKITAMLEQAKLKLANATEKANKLMDDTVNLVNKVNLEIDSGEINSANQLLKKVQSNIKAIDNLGHKKISELKSASQNCSNRLFELNKWRSWANTPQKERLIAEVEVLIDSDLDPKEIAFLVSQARKNWQKLGPSEKENSQELWEKFNKACEAAYEPCKAVFADEARIRDENLDIRNKFLTDLEKFVENQQWESANWNKIENLFYQSRKEWNNLGIVDKNKRKALNARFNKAHNTLKNQLHAVWQKNLIAKKEIVAQALDAISLEDLDEAINLAKKLQSDWKKIGKVQRSDERELWGLFRSHCDKIFARRDEVREQQKVTDSEVTDNKKALVEKIESLCQTPATNISEVEPEIYRTKKEIDALPSSSPSVDKEIRTKIDQSLHILEIKKEASGRINQVSTLHDLKNKIELLQSIEELVENKKSVNWEESKQKFCALKPLAESHWDEMISERFSQLESGEDIEAMQQKANQNLPLIQNATIQLEIIADIDTPKASAPDRLKVQAERLSNKLQNHEDESQWEAFIQNEANWLLTGPLPAEQLSEFRQRHIAIIEALKKQYSEELHNY